MTEIRANVVKKIADKNETAQAVFSLLAVRERNRGDINLSRLRYDLLEEGFNIVPEDLLATFKELQTAGFGELIQHKNQPARFKWFVNLKDVGQAALGDKPAPHREAFAIPSPPIKPSSNMPALNVKDLTKEAIMSYSQRLVVCFDNSRCVDIDFPVDITKSEAKFIYEKILKAVKK